MQHFLRSGKIAKTGDSTMATTVAQRTRVDASPRLGRRYIPTVAFGADLVSIAFSVVAAIQGRAALHFPLEVSTSGMANSLAVLGPVMILGWVAVILALGGYRQQVFGAGLDEYKRVVNASLITGAAVGISCFLLQFPLSRGFFVLAFLIGIPALVTGRLLLRRGIHRARIRGSLQYRVVVAGDVGHVDEIASVLRREKWLGYHVVGAIVPQPGDRESTPSGIPLLGSTRAIAGLAVAAKTDVVFLAGGAFSSSTEMRRLAWDLEYEDISVVIAPSVSDVSRERMSMRPVGGVPLIHLEKPRSQDAGRRAKRTFDIVATVSLLFLFTPIFCFAAVQVWMHDHGSIFFRQTRVGRDGRTFRLWKFRTMVINAEELLAQMRQQEGHEGGLFKMDHDPRVTKPGTWLRRFSVDELPQLLNVLRGDMSLVGPRPPLKHEVAQYDDAMARRLRVRPGMTGLWQVSGRSDLSWSETVRLDLYYVDNWSMAQDLTILARTFGAVLSSRGAY
jgi:exopolysaccharide biosynthesis polyprenyl glycosylphosphotransferase